MRPRILGLLDERVASPRELSGELGAPLENVSYHVRELTKLGLIKLVGTTRRRGAIEHHYTAVAAPYASKEAWGEWPPIVRRRVTAAGLAEMFEQLNEAAAGGGFVADDTHLSRTRLVLDAQGRKALAKELEATMRRAHRIQQQARRRLGSNREAEQRISLVILPFDDVAAPNDKTTVRSSRRRTAPRASRDQTHRSTPVKRTH